MKTRVNRQIDEFLASEKNEATEVAVTIRPAVLWFAEQMELKLRENDHKGGWDTSDVGYLRDRLREESVELEMSLDSKPNTESIREAADVANFAMMIADSCISDNHESNWRKPLKVQSKPPAVTVTGCVCGQCEEESGSATDRASAVEPAFSACSLPEPNPRNQFLDRWILGCHDTPNEANRYVPYSDLLAVEQKLAERIETVDCPADLRDLDALWLAQTESGWKLFAKEPGYANTGYVSESKYSLEVVERQEFDRVTKERDGWMQEAAWNDEAYRKACGERDEVVVALRALAAQILFYRRENLKNKPIELSRVSLSVSFSLAQQAEEFLARIDARRTEG